MVTVATIMYMPHASTHGPAFQFDLLRRSPRVAALASGFCSFVGTNGLFLIGHLFTLRPTPA
eukprot:4018481-Lingulodinium_polyedra.AAC.1